MIQLKQLEVFDLNLKTMKNKLSIKSKIFLSFSIAIIFIVNIFAVFLFNITKNNIIDENKKNILNEFENIKTLIDAQKT
jgi:CHASE3 domain sensor protein